MPQNNKHGYKDPTRKWGYYAVKYLFKTMITIFYSEVEVVGSSNFPVEGPVIVAINHCNSLTDAAITLHSCPRDVRLTCKDSLLTQPGFMSLLIRNIESIPFQRRSDYKNETVTVDNTASINTLLKELSVGCCVGLFPEGLCRYKPQLSEFRTGVARTAIDYVLNVLSGSGDIESSYKYIHIVPVAITYIHREMFRSDVSVRINSAIKIDEKLLEQHNVNINDKIHLAENKYLMAKEITKKLHDSIINATISSPDWHTICLSHLCRQIAFVESSNPRQGIFCAQYVDLTSKFCHIFTKHCEDSQVKECIAALAKYWKLLYYYGLKDVRIFEMQQLQKTSNKKIRISKMSIFLRIIYRGIAAAMLCSMAMPGFVLALPLVISFRIIRYKKIKAGLCMNYDEIAHTKMAAILLFVPLLTIIYSLVIGKKISSFFGKIFVVIFPFVLWTTMRLSQDGTAQLRSFWSLLKMLFLSQKNKKILIKNRKICQLLVNKLVEKFNINYDYKIIDIINNKSSATMYNRNVSYISYMIKRLYYGRVKNDWNETIRLYDVPVDEFHLNDKYQQQLQLSYAYK